ncbi:C2 calcium-dependent membrane targeting [Forsythia ovata]|uniref:C2 calcium-dependent membrane targeting n=1 Tax=Forsythia ovata TaxID=205694 RepID=A0ABD1NZ60_9LAMI
MLHRIDHSLYSKSAAKFSGQKEDGKQRRPASTVGEWGGRPRLSLTEASVLIFKHIKEFLEYPATAVGNNGRQQQFVSYQVRKPNGQPKGQITFSYKFAEKVGGSAAKIDEEPVTAYPAVGPSFAYPPPSLGVYPPFLVDQATGQYQPPVAPGVHPLPPPGEYPSLPRYGYLPPPPYGRYPPPPRSKLKLIFLLITCRKIRPKLTLALFLEISLLSLLGYKII